MADLVVWRYERFVCEGDGFEFPDPAGETGSFDTDLTGSQDQLVWADCAIRCGGRGHCSKGRKR